MASQDHVTIDHVPTREEVLAALGKQGIDDLDDLAEAIVAEARDAAESDDEAFEALDIWNTPWGHLIHTQSSE
jgi:hypothetical protein